MSYLRHFKFVLLTGLFVDTCFGQTTCLPLYGSDALHPNGLSIPASPLKPSPKPNAIPNYIWPAPQGAQVLWNAAQGVVLLSAHTVVNNGRQVVSGCVPAPPAGSPPPPPQPVPFTSTPAAQGAHALAIADFNHDGILDAIVVTPGTNKISVYLGKLDGTFQTPATVALGTPASKFAGIVVTDFNNDRKADIAVVDTAGNLVYVAFGKGDGTFVNPTPLAVGHSPTSITAADVNNDSVPDIIVTNSADSTVSVIRGNGDGTFIPASTFAVGKNPVSVIVQDLNGDGNPDLIVADNGSSDIAYLQGLGTGLFQPAMFTKAPAPPTYLASADFTDDGIPDIVALAANQNTVMMFVGGVNGVTGKLTFTGAYLTPNVASSVSINDFNADGFLDVLIPDTDNGTMVILLGRGDGTLAAPPVYASNNGFTSLATADFDGDGNADLLYTGSNATTSTLSLQYGNGNGTFKPPVNIPVSGRTDVVAVGDFNGDGRPDIAVSGSQLNILLGQAGGTFRSGAQYPNLIPSVVADFNKDGKLDIAGPMGGQIGVLLGNGDGTFRTANLVSAGANPKTAVAADFNLDRSVDLAVINPGTTGNPNDPGGITVLFGNGGGAFSSSPLLPAGSNPVALAAQDVNHDGKPDLIVATGVTGETGYQVMVLLGKGDGTFQTPFSVKLPAGETPSAITIMDIDGDGNPDIIAADCCTDSSTNYLRGNGDGTFSPPVAFYAGNSPRSMVVGDWNGDGKPDLAFGTYASDMPSASAITVLVNRLTNPQPVINTNGASFRTGLLAPNLIVSAFGNNLTTDTASASGDPTMLPTSLANTMVKVTDSKGVPRFAQLFYVSPTQINYLVPDGTALGVATVEIIAPNGVTSAMGNVAAVAPGIFQVGQSGLAAATGVHVQGPNQSAFNVYYLDPSGILVPIPINMGAKNDRVYLQLFATGLRGRTSTDNVVVNIGGMYTPAVYAGPQSQYPGLDQLNIQIPPALAGAGRVTINVTVDGVVANPVYVVIQ